MMSKATRALEASLKGLNYPEIERVLANAEAAVLIELLDSTSIKIGDSAAGLIRGKEACRLLISSILEKRITTKFGKIRANNTLFGTGRRYADALKAYLTLLEDPNDEIADNALLALVFWGDKGVIPAIKARAKSVKSTEHAMEFARACDALEKCDPASFNPHFRVAAGIWN